MKLKIKPRPAPKPPAYSYDPRIDGVSQSMLGTWFECREKARLTIVKGYQRTHASKPLIWGSIGHNMIGYGLNATREKKLKASSAIKYLTAASQELAKKAKAEWEAKDKPDSAAAMEIAEEACAVLAKTMPLYWKRWAEADVERKWDFVEEAFKVPFEMPDGKDVYLVGKFDGVFTSPKAKTSLFETKFKGSIPEHIVDTLPLDLQVSVYMAALYVLNRPLPRLATYNIVKRPGERRKKDESLQDYADRIAVNAAAEPNHYFNRFEVTFTAQELEAMGFRVQKTVEEFYHWWKNLDHDTMDPVFNSSSCDSKYGPCDCLPICSRGDFASHRVRSVAHPEI